ncbi:unnamed protein product [Adineta steineri]|uniref:G domain-containing protein n=1 Tax=Adineta steineri TaxID=433720 RepID=A0A814Y1I0_9BILA|nr:unnamed protein product [Adineta steineri]CAF1223348.1 unnamed protein product [Adineta steineri]
MSKEFSIVVCGSARVGKSTLVNAICGREVARTSGGLCAETDRMDKYVINHIGGASSNEHTITIYDTPGIESWTENHVRSYFTKIMNESKPVCMIYCASPGSYAQLDQLQWLIDTCIKSNIFCALVCTNKYCGGYDRRTQVLRDFHSLLIRYHGMTRDEANIKYYGNVALCTAVNSIVYEDREFNVRKEIEGINELIFGILTSLKNEKIAGWCYTIANNRPFWETMQPKIIAFFEVATPIAIKIIDKHGMDIANVLINLILLSIKRGR